jgi:hypothetical protein
LFITATYLLSPISGQFNHDPNNIQRSESVQIIKRLKDRDLKTANIILDISNKSIVKCRTSKENGTMFNGDEDYKEIYAYFNLHYHDQIENALKLVV